MPTHSSASIKLFWSVGILWLTYISRTVHSNGTAQSMHSHQGLVYAPLCDRRSKAPPTDSKELVKEQRTGRLILRSDRGASETDGPIVPKTTASIEVSSIKLLTGFTWSLCLDERHRIPSNKSSFRYQRSKRSYVQAFQPIKPSYYCDDSEYFKAHMDRILVP